MEVNAVTSTGAPVIHSAPVMQSAQGNQIIRVEECEDKLNHLGNCYGCNKPGHMMRDCTEKKNTNNSFRNNYNKGPRRDSRDITCYNCDKKGHFARDCRGPKRNNRRSDPQDTEENGSGNYSGM